MINTIEADPNPEYLIKSIAEQGYSMQTALADLIDNSISAGADRIEILTDLNESPFRLFLTDNGTGMDLESLKRNMHFPSQSPEVERSKKDLGRFGLGMKTASFSQTRFFTVVSRKGQGYPYSAITWDVDYLKATGKWRMIINSRNEIEKILSDCNRESNNHNHAFSNYSPNTIISWKGLYKYENSDTISHNRDHLNSDITEIGYYLGLVFHRFMERKSSPLKIRINNRILEPFDPFPSDQIRLRALEPAHKELGKGSIKIQGYVLPHSSIKEADQGNCPWTLPNKSLMDMEGVYVYRADRLIIYGGWIDIIKKIPRLQLARMKMDIGNGTDSVFQLNVAKSQISIPHDFKDSLHKSIMELQQEAQKELHNFSTSNIQIRKRKDRVNLYKKVSTNKGTLLAVNEEFTPLIALEGTLTAKQKSLLKLILNISTTFLNQTRLLEHVELAENKMTAGDISMSIEILQKMEMTTGEIIRIFKENKIDLPDEAVKLLSEK